MGEQPERRPDEPRSFGEIEVISPGERRSRRERDRELPQRDADSAEPTEISSDGAGVKP